jgi:photosystem II stability/assembly factor-like uncharacterized protein
VDLKPTHFNMYRFRSALFLLFTLLMATAQAGWDRYDGPNGGMAIDLIEHNGVLFAATEHGLQRSTDGQHWTLVAGGLPETYFNSLASNGSALLVGSYNYGVYRSTNNGGSWQSVDVTSVNDLHFAAGCFYSANDVSGLRQSCNGGLTWQSADPNGHLGTFMQGLGSDGTYVYSIGAGQLKRTNNGGSTWTAVMNGLPSFVSPLKVTGNSQRQVLTTVQHGVFLSTDHGNNWTATNVYPQPPTTWSGYSILLEGDTLHIGVNYYGGVRRSTDGGVTWTSVNTGLPPALSPHVLLRHGSDLLMGTNRGIWRGVGALPQWGHSDSGVPHTSLTRMVELNGTLFASTRATEVGQSEGVHRSTDGGLTWQPRNSGLATELNFNALFAGQGVLLANAQLNTYRSADQGATWTNLLGNGPDDVVTAFVEWNGAIYAGTDGSGIFRSTDAGLTFTAVASPNPIVHALHVFNGALYAGTVSGLHSTTNGTTWTALTNGLSGVLDIRAITSGADVLVVSAKSGAYTQLYRSTNAGGNWSLANSGMPYPMVCEALVFHNDTLFAGMDNSWPLNSSATPGLYASADGGQTWADASAGMPTGTSVRCFLVTSEGRLLAGTHREGVWGRSAELATAVPDGRTAPAVTLWPNPTNGTLHLRAEDGSALGEVHVFDGTGALVTHARHTTPQTTLDLSALPQGMYFVRTLHQGRERSQRVVKVD